MNFTQLIRPYHPLQWLFSLVAFCILLISIGIAILLGPNKIARALHQWTTPMVRISTGPAVSVAPSVRENAIEHRAAEIDGLLKRKWADSLLAIEQVQTKDVTVLEFHPDYANASFVVHGEARQFEALSNYIGGLNATGLVRNVALMHENGVSREHVDTIEFELKGNL
ncbi:hypothetical protein [Sapientia aquatica]|uniref:Uncharacterized protein n=1 Tax=Sapientia aquatica TaxID=1549640 RepID=A0A4R5VN78_9BURK|nr:hypothetical protein [Sapientia aquatica]TDK59580.1 hypothetical protein E2I14_18700 [Sapientia aquatica]